MGWFLVSFSVTVVHRVTTIYRAVIYRFDCMLKQRKLQHQLKMKQNTSNIIYLGVWNVQDTGCTLFLYYIVPAFDSITCLSLAFVQDTGCTLFFCYIMRAFDFMICFVACLCVRHWLYSIFILLHCVSLWFYNLLCFLLSCKTLYWLCTIFILQLHCISLWFYIRQSDAI